MSSEKARIQEALAASEANYRCIFNTANDAILIHDAETGRILDVNDRMCEMYGYSRDEALQLIISDISANEPPYSQEDALKRVRNAVEEGPQTFEWLGRKKNEDQFWVEVNLKRITIGGQARVMAIVRDITERKKTEDALKESQRTLSTLMSNLPGMAYRCHPDTSWTMELVSDGCKELTGYLP
ncbi:MAG TPA: PAS domain S-box protein, partial [Armatimonadota bacterium]|nr:PAS domain S-box protein [Armatimonadota bacterium]